MVSRNKLSYLCSTQLPSQGKIKRFGAFGIRSPQMPTSVSNVGPGKSLPATVLARTTGQASTVVPTWDKGRWMATILTRPGCRQSPSSLKLPSKRP